MRQSRIVDSSGQAFVLPAQARALPHSLAQINWRRALARYDAAQTTDDNIRHWSQADSLSADSANSPAVRRILRNRSRYEAANNSYCRSMVETLANDVVGSGPRVQIISGAGRAADQFVEREITWWMQAAKCPQKLRLMRKNKAIDGEGIGLLTTKRRLPTPVKLGMRVLESEQLSTPNMTGAEQNAVDGVRFDSDGDPIEYDVLRYHPGDSSTSYLLQSDVVPASEVIHLFREDRAGQHRGIPELTPALPLFSQLRRFTLATLAAAETAAEFAAVIQTSRPESGGLGASPGASVPPPEPMDVFELSQRMVTVLPDGYQLSQVKAEHPTTTYGEFKREILAEAFSALVMPYAVGANDSKDYNFASGKLDRRGYARAVSVERVLEWEPEVYRLVFSWYLEANLIGGYLPTGMPPFSQWQVRIYWDEIEDDIDPVKAATAQQTRLESHTTTLAYEYARKGKDWEAELRQRAVEIKLQKELGLIVDLRPESFGDMTKQPQKQQKQPVPQDDEESDDE
jgi:lambda family phage portal protein